jgi:hypothetical protein
MITFDVVHKPKHFRGERTLKPWNVKPGDLLLIWDLQAGETDARPVTGVEKERRWFGHGFMWRIYFTSGFGRTESVFRFREDNVGVIRGDVK